MSFFLFLKFDPGITYLLVAIVCILQFEQIFPKEDSKRASINKIKIEEKEAFLLKKKLHKLKYLTQKAIRRLGDSSDYDEFESNYLKNILRVRVPGTIGHHEVQKFIIANLKENGWHVDIDEFTNATPLGDRKFTNIIATLNPDAERTLAIAAHYDSKLMTPENGKYFLAATDSAVPCAMMLDFAKLLAEKSKKLHKDLTDVSPMLLFLDGEEAFVQWSKNDSIYGSRHLAQVFANRTHHRKSLVGKSVTFADSIDAFVLLDLLGTAQPQIFDMYPSTEHLYNRLHLIENSLKQEGQISNTFPYFVGKANQPINIEDDHLPFLEKGIPILHVIPVPFPTQWHQLSDDQQAIDPPTVKNLLKIFRQFLLEYFHLS